jgi:hypothetical protein
MKSGVSAPSYRGGFADGMGFSGPGYGGRGVEGERGKKSGKLKTDS